MSISQALSSVIQELMMLTVAEIIILTAVFIVGVLINLKLLTMGEEIIGMIEKITARLAILLDQRKAKKSLSFGLKSNPWVVGDYYYSDHSGCCVDCIFGKREENPYGIEIIKCCNDFYENILPHYADLSKPHSFKPCEFTGLRFTYKFASRYGCTDNISEQDRENGYEIALF